MNFWTKLRTAKIFIGGDFNGPVGSNFGEARGG